MRFTLWVAIIVLLAGQGQHKNAKPAAQPADAPPSAAPATVPVSDAAYKKIRDLQYRQDRKLLQLKDLKLQEDQIQKEIDDLSGQIRQAAYDEAVKAGVDVEKNRLQLDTLTWQEIQKGESK
jgi:TolA-binding protein